MLAAKIILHYFPLFSIYVHRYYWQSHKKNKISKKKCRKRAKINSLILQRSSCRVVHCSISHILCMRSTYSLYTYYLKWIKNYFIQTFSILLSFLIYFQNCGLALNLISVFFMFSLSISIVSYLFSCHFDRVKLIFFR